MFAARSKRYSGLAQRHFKESTLSVRVPRRQHASSIRVNLLSFSPSVVPRDALFSAGPSGGDAAFDSRKHQQHLWRQLQARTFLTPARLALFHPGMYSPACRFCGSSIANCEHILYSRPAHLPPCLLAPQKSAAVAGCFVQHQTGPATSAGDLSGGRRGYVLPGRHNRQPEGRPQRCF
ncbi:hypothetical protein MRX96_059511 [Rhipicephalus microplus]